MNPVKPQETRYHSRAKTLNAFHRSNARVRIIQGPMGSGKTSAGVCEGFRRCCEQKPDEKGIRRSRGLVIRNTYGDLRETTIPSWNEWFEPLGLPEVSKVAPYNQELRFALPDQTIVEAKVIFLALDRPKDVRKLRSYNVTWCFLDEVKEMPLLAVEFAFGRCGRFPSKNQGGPSWYGLWAVTNAMEEGHYLYDMQEKPDEKPEGWEFFKQPPAVIREGKRWFVNPAAENLENHTPDYYHDQLETARDDYIRVNLANQYGTCIDGQRVIEAYDDDRHCSPTPLELRPDLPIWLGLDFGLTPAALFGQRLHTNIGYDFWHWCRELVTEVSIRQGAEEFARLLRPEIERLRAEGFTFAGIYGDPAGDQEAQTDRKTPFEILHAESIPAFPAPTNDFKIRRAVVNDSFAQNRILVDPRCTRAREGLRGGYCYPRIATLGGQMAYSPTPRKSPSSHVIEAGGYMMLGAGDMANVVEAVEQPKAAAYGFDETELSEED